jgi:ketosteroid isomerase-like protein
VSRENVELLRKGFEDFNEHGVDALMDIIDADFEGIAVPELSVEPQTYRGHEGVRRYFRSFYEVMEDIRFEPVELIDAGDEVVVAVVLSARGMGTGLEAEQRAFQVWTLREGKAVRLKTFADREEALAAAGLAEERPEIEPEPS